MPRSNTMRPAPVIFLAAETGMRRGELCGLKWGDVDLGRPRIVVSRAVAAVPDGMIEKTTKTNASRRIALDKATVSTMERYRRQAEEWAASAGVSLGPNASGLQAFVSTSYAMHTQRTCWPPACPLRIVNGRLGHANAMTTLNAYAH